MTEIYEQEEASISETDVDFAIDRGRGDKTEFFATIPESELELAITACAMANNGGGQILLGVDKSGTIIGVEDREIEEEAKQILDEYLERGIDKKYVTSGVQIDSDVIIVILMDGSKKYPLAADGRFYRRNQEENFRLRPDGVWELMKDRVSENYDR
jgi:predicted HTH transcriptional regulator